VPAGPTTPYPEGARQLVDAAAQYSDVTPSGLTRAEPFTGSGYLLARSVAPDDLVARGLQLSARCSGLA
jgi:hypothetical protein